MRHASVFCRLFGWIPKSTTMPVENQLQHTIGWILGSRKHISPKAQLLRSTGVVLAAEYYQQNNDLGLLIMSGLTREQFEQRMIAMVGTIESHWHEWRSNESKKV